jgi:hypothetical protein
MNLTRRFIFRGNASALSGRIYRPNDFFLDANCASSLTVAGGRSVSRAGPKQFGDIVRFESAFTSAEGVFDDTKQAIEMTYGRVAQGTLMTSTTVTSELQDLVIGIKPRLTVHRLRGTLNAKSPGGGGQTPITLGSDTVVEGVSVDGYPLIVELNLPLFQKFSTLAQLQTAADDPGFVDEHGDCLFMRSALSGVPPPTPAGRLIQGCGLTYGTIVRSIRWADKPYPESNIDHHSLTVKDIGTIFFGEILISEADRRLTMIRFDLGSPDGGNGAGGEGQSNGGFSP